ncbi:MAG: hypothetical protein HOC74_27385 [Gemmatimonadetes bacterium]|nr:hypothetical protein [Gemmatimonadota bacterium]
MEEMVEPDRTIMVVSIIGLIIIWGSFFYHKYVQGGGNVEIGKSAKDEREFAGEGEGEAEAIDGMGGEIGKGEEKPNRGGKGKGKKKKKR